MKTVTTRVALCALAAVVVSSCAKPAAPVTEAPAATEAAQPATPAAAEAPVASEAASAPAAAPANGLPSPVLADFKAALGKDMIAETISWSWGEVDVTGDGQKEYLIMPRSMDFCGSGGCTLFVVEQREGTWTPISKTTVASTPVRVATTKTKGAFDILVESSGKTRALKFDGKRWSSNASVAPVASETEITSAKLVIAD